MMKYFVHHFIFLIQIYVDTFEAYIYLNRSVIDCFESL